MGKTAILAVRIISDTNQARQGFDKTAGSVSKLGGIGSAVATGLGAAAVAVGAIAVKGVQGAADLEQSVGAIDTVFEGSAGQMHKWASAAATSVGLTKNEYNELGTLIGTQLANGGTAMDQLAPKTNQLIELGADLSSMFGGTSREAVEALSSALKGERDPIEKYGVSLKQATIDAKAAELGFKKVGGSLSDEANQAATLALISEQTAKAHGNFAREAGTVQGQMQRMQATMDNTVTSIGTALLPIVNQLLGAFSTYLLPVLTGAADAFTNFMGSIDISGAFKQVTDSLKPFGAILSGIGQQFAPLGAMLMTFVTTGVVPLAQAIGAQLAPLLSALAQTLIPPLVAAFQAIIPVATSVLGSLSGLAQSLGSVLAPAIQFLGPLVTTTFGVITSVITSALGVIQGIVSTVSAALQGDWSGAWEGIKQTAVAAVGLIGNILSGAGQLIVSIGSVALSALGSVVSAGVSAVVGFFAGLIGRVGSALSGLASTLVSIGSSALTSLGSAVATGVAAVITWFAGLPGRVSSALSGLGSLLSGLGASALRAMGSAINSGISAVVGFFRSLGSRIAGAVSGIPGTLSRVGSQMIQGLIGGIKSMANRAVGAVKDVVSNTIRSAKSMLGIASPSKVFTAIGTQTGQGLITGLGRMKTGVKRASSAMVGAAVPKTAPTIDINARLNGRGTHATAGPSINLEVNFNGLVTDPLATAREIERVFKNHIAVTGRPIRGIA